MPYSGHSNSGGIYHVPITQAMEEKSHQYCNIVKWALCFIPWCCSIVLVIYVWTNFHKLHETYTGCKNELVEIDRNASVVSAQIGVVKQQNDELNNEIKKLKINLELTHEKLKVAQDKIDLYYQTINELKANLNLKISSDFLRKSSINGATVRGTNIVIMFASILLLSFYYYVIWF